MTPPAAIPPARFFDTIDSTWPAARFLRTGPWLLRDGQGGGKRVSAASTDADVTPEDVATAVQGMADMGQPPLFQIRPGQDALDAQLAALGYDLIDACNAYVIPVAELTRHPVPRVTILPHWEPLALSRELWATGDIGPARIEVMHRTKGPKTALMGRQNDRPAGIAFVAIHAGIAMLHALEILPRHRQQGLGKWMMRGAGEWAARNGARSLGVICTCSNQGANALYASLGMQPVGGYHYRHLPEQRTTP